MSTGDNTSNFWEDKLTKRELSAIHRLLVALNLPDQASYPSLEHLLADVNSRVSEARSLAHQTAKVLGA